MRTSPETSPKGQAVDVDTVISAYAHVNLRSWSTFNPTDPFRKSCVVGLIAWVLPKGGELVVLHE
jgi:hypothetical protein